MLPSLRVFAPSRAYRAGVDRTRRSALGRWQAEQTADVYTRQHGITVEQVWDEFLAQATTEEASVATTVAVGAGAGFAGAAVVMGAALLYKRATGDARLSFQKREVSSMRSPDGLSMST